MKNEKKNTKPTAEKKIELADEKLENVTGGTAKVSGGGLYLSTSDETDGMMRRDYEVR